MIKKFFPLFLLLISFSFNTYGEIKDITWEIGPNIPEFRKGCCVGSIDGKVITVFGMRFPWGEMATMYVYDPVTNWWSRGTDAPVGQCYVMGTNCGEAFYSAGGRMGEKGFGKVHSRCFKVSKKPDSTYEYTWEEIQSLNKSRAWAPCVTVGTKVYVVGGSDGAWGPTISSVEVFDTADPKGKWTIITTIPGKSRGWSSTVSVKGKIYLIGGCYSPSEEAGKQKGGMIELNEVVVFDPATLTWTQKSPLPYTLSAMDCCVYNDQYIIVVGGGAGPLVGGAGTYTEDMKKKWESDPQYKSYYCPFVLVYDTKTDEWRVLPSLLPMPTSDIHITMIGKKIYALGGENIEPATSNTTPWLRIGQIIE